MVVPTVQARGRGSLTEAQRHRGGLSGNAETPPCSPWLCERKNAEG